MEQADQLTSLVARPTESLNVEIKTWLDLNASHAKAKLVRSHRKGCRIIGMSAGAGECV